MTPAVPILDPQTVPLVGRADLIRGVIDVIKANPENINPTDGAGTCLYTSERKASHRCLVGEYAHTMGWTVPPTEWVGPADDAAERFGWPVKADALLALVAIQDHADQNHQGWLTILPNIERML